MSSIGFLLGCAVRNRCRLVYRTVKNISVCCSTAFYPRPYATTSAVPTIERNGPWYLCRPSNCHLKIIDRYKYTKKKTQDKEESSDSEYEDDGILDDKSSKVVKGHMASLRVDNVIKAGLGIARNKVETLFYESRIRVNGCKIPKKSFKVDVGDEVDVIKESSRMNEEFLNVSRIVILFNEENKDGDGLVVKMRRYKTLTIEDYPNDPWKRR